MFPDRDEAATWDLSFLPSTPKLPFPVDDLLQLLLLCSFLKYKYTDDIRFTKMQFFHFENSKLCMKISICGVLNHGGKKKKLSIHPYLKKPSPCLLHHLLSPPLLPQPPLPLLVLQAPLLAPPQPKQTEIICNIKKVDRLHVLLLLLSWSDKLNNTC